MRLSFHVLKNSVKRAIKAKGKELHMEVSKEKLLWGGRRWVTLPTTDSILVLLYLTQRAQKWMVQRTPLGEVERRHLNQATEVLCAGSGQSCHGAAESFPIFGSFKAQCLLRIKSGLLKPNDLWWGMLQSSIQLSNYHKINVQNKALPVKYVNVWILALMWRSTLF